MRNTRRLIRANEGHGRLYFAVAFRIQFISIKYIIVSFQWRRRQKSKLCVSYGNLDEFVTRTFCPLSTDRAFLLNSKSKT